MEQFVFRAEGKQNGGREYDDLQNLLDMTLYENPLYEC